MTYDGTEYDLIEIGDQCWFRQDLATTVYKNGEAVSLPATSVAWADQSSDSSYYMAFGDVLFYNYTLRVTNAGYALQGMSRRASLTLKRW